MTPLLTVLNGDAITQLTKLPDASVQCCVTSPPYWGLRDYGCAGQLGLEKTPEEYVCNMVQVFREVRRVLRDDGTLWLNLGDSYAGGGKGGNPPESEHQKQKTNRGSLLHAGLHETARLAGAVDRSWQKPPPGIKCKDLVGIPWMVAFALRADGWYLRSDIIWHKPNQMPESVTDRPTKSHEYLFLLTKSQRYYYDAEAIKEPCKESSIARLGQDVENQLGSDRVPGKTNGRMKAVKFGGNNLCPDTRLQSGKEWQPKHKNIGVPGRRDHTLHVDRISGHNIEIIMANKKSVWSVPTQPFKGSHFATFPPDLIKPCILAGSKAGDTILDPFGGSGTTGMVSLELGRKAVLIELNAEYVKLIGKRCDVTPGLALV